MKIMKKKKILYLGNKLSQHGINATTVETLGARLAELGYDVHSFSSQKNPILRLCAMLLGIVKHRTSDFILIDTYSTTAFWFAFCCSQVARLFRIPYVPILHGGNLPERLQHHPFWCQLIFKNAYHIVSPSAYLVTKFALFGYTTVSCIPNAITLSDYIFTPRTFFAPNLLWVRAFDQIYNPQMAVTVFSLLQQKYPKATLTMVGPDKDSSLQDTKNYADALGLKVTFTGKLSKAAWTDLAQDHAVFINTTHFDNMPVSVLEAMALGLPVVSTNVGGIPFLITHDTTGFLVADGDAEAMAREVEKLLTHPAATQNVVDQAYHFVSQMDWDKVAPLWTILLQ